ncbi:histone, partial [Photobacterium phosphoreum]|nr:histone [Photobacterium phosphoreum]
QAKATKASATAPAIKKTINPAGSWPFPTGERP